MEKVFATKKDLEKFLTKEDALKVFATKQDLEDFRYEFKNEMRDKFGKSLALSDKILKKLETLLQEKKIGDWQTKRRRRPCRIMVETVRKGKFLSPKQYQKIKELDVL